MVSPFGRLALLTRERGRICRAALKDSEYCRACEPLSPAVAYFVASMDARSPPPTRPSRPRVMFTTAI
jgi:hypothetical protein